MNNNKMKKEIRKLSYVELQKRLKHTERKLKECSNETERLKSLFLANISHEIRTPMNAILGFSCLLKDANLTESDKNAFIDGITESSNKLLNTMDSIIQAAKIESKEVSLKEEGCDINHLMSDLFSLYNKNKGSIGKGHIELRLIKEANGNPCMLTDISKLKQILSNLIDNALKFTESGYIQFGYNFPDKNNIQFFVTDTGIGIPADKCNAIFEKFSQVETIYSKRHNGLGVGLSISNNFVQQLGGIMNIRSTSSKGSEFYFNLPYIATTNTKTKSIDTDNLNPAQQCINQIIKKSNGSQKKIDAYTKWSQYNS